MSNLDKLLNMIDGEIEVSPVEYKGLTWCAFTQEQLAARLYVSRATVKRLLSSDKVQRHVYRPGEKKVTLLRRHDGKTTAEFQVLIDAKAMSREFERVTGRRPSDAEFGCLIGLAKAWPPKLRRKIFSHNLRYWDEFMAGYKQHKEADPDTLPDWKPRYLKYPSIKTMLDATKTCNGDVAWEAYTMHLQDNGKMAPGQWIECQHSAK